jgi:hypothetical protein
MQLQIDSVQVQGNIALIIARFDLPGIYSIVYGRFSTEHPVYDIDNFKDKIPDSLAEISPGPELNVSPEPPSGQPGFIHYRLLMWGILVLVMLMLGWFTLIMIKKKSTRE